MKKLLLVLALLFSSLTYAKPDLGEAVILHVDNCEMPNETRNLVCFRVSLEGKTYMIVFVGTIDHKLQMLHLKKELMYLDSDGKVIWHAEAKNV